MPTNAQPSTFAALDLPRALVKTLAQQGLTDAFPIQSDTIPAALTGRDIVGRAATGSGKTLAFVLPLLGRLEQLPRGKKPAAGSIRALILSPTRELAMQIADVVDPLAQALGQRHALVCGGMSYTRQLQALSGGTDVVIATPGRLADLIEQGHASLNRTQIVVIDEADHMADMGFLPEVSALLDRVPRGGQRMLFSATLERGVGGLVQRYLTNPSEIHSEQARANTAAMRHHGLLVQFRHKHHILAQLANGSNRTVIFVRTKRGAEQTASDLRESGVMAASLHGDLSQRQRNRVMQAFKHGNLPVLVATDVAARGIHVDDVATVIQADPPGDHKDYLHRAGRTARAGNHGNVITLVLPNQRRTMQALAQQAGVDLRLEPARPGDATLAGLGYPAPDYTAAVHPVTDEAIETLLAQREHRPARHRIPRNGERSHRAPRRNRTGNRAGKRTGERHDAKRHGTDTRTADSTANKPRGKARRAKRY